MRGRRVYIREAAERLGRVPHTLRTWEYDGVLPARLLPRRDEANRRYWTEAQLGAIERWIARTRRHPGKGLKGYSPSPAKVREHIERMRGPRGSAGRAG